jgi:hypothetical protein
MSPNSILLPFNAMQICASKRSVRFLIVVMVLQGALLRASAGSADPYRGLWVGEVTLNYVNEVAVPLDENNSPVAPDPKVPTPTKDKANLRLILHVNGFGQVNLLKDVAVLNRRSGTNTSGVDSDLALVTDETLYGEFPPQPALRVASAVFDFGDSKATEAVDAMIEAVVMAVTNSVATNTANLNSTSGQANAENAATADGSAAGNAVIANSDTEVSYDNFLRSTAANEAAVDKMASSSSLEASTARNAALTAATNLQSLSFFADPRGIEMVLAVSNAVAAVTTGEAKTNAAQNTAASFADLDDGYDRLIAGKQFGDMIAAAAAAAAAAAVAESATTTTISNAVNSNVAVNDARTEAIRIQVTLYRDTRGSNAIAQVTDAIIANAASFLSGTNLNQAVILASADQAGRDALATVVARYQLPSQVPSSDYNTFVRSSVFETNAPTAARAAAKAAILERSTNPLYTLDSLKREAKMAALNAMQDVYAEAARAGRNELPMLGKFGPGEGDPRLTWVVKQTNSIVNLGPPALTGSIRLPARHPTNPFRHRRHPDHTVGYDITRNIRIDFDTASPGPLPRAGFGVERISGTYREEVFGLHKPLGPLQDTGLSVEGTFQLSRISSIDTLNAR